MRKDYLRFLLLANICGFWAVSATAAISVFSDYGLIQNVQNYSTNPFWSPNSPYNQRLPQPVYVQGTDLNADDCLRVVQSLVAAQCMTKNNCKNTALSEIRPNIMVQLSNMSGHNYVSACGGYIDGAFDSYVKQYGNTIPNRATSFPDATTPNPNLNNSGGVIFQNPYKTQPAKWQQEIGERAKELLELQNQNGADGYGLSANQFPKTYEDLSFTQRMEYDRAGLMPYKDLKAYKTIDIKNIAEWCAESDHKSSDACKKYRDCTDLLKKNDANIVRAEYDSSHTNCRVIECKDGFTYNSQRTGCINKPGKSCLTDKMTQNDPNITAAEYKDDNKCEVTACIQGYHVNAAKNGCDVDLTNDQNYEIQEELKNNEEQKQGETQKTEESQYYYVAKIGFGTNRRPNKSDGPGNCFSTCGYTKYRKTVDFFNKVASQELSWWKSTSDPKEPKYCSSPNNGFIMDTDKGENVLLTMTKEQQDELAEIAETKISDNNPSSYCDGFASKLYLQLGHVAKNPGNKKFSETFEISKEIVLDD